MLRAYRRLSSRRRRFRSSHLEVLRSLAAKIAMASGVNESTTDSSSPFAVPPTRYWLIALYLVALVATAIVTPMFFLGNASGHDFQVHLASWVETAGQWRQGIIYPRWAEWASSGFGEPRFIFYPPASWILGAALGSVLPWKIVPGVFIWITIIIAGMSMWKFAREWLSPTQAIAAGIFFAANPYHLALIYYRSDFAELLASALFPLMLWGAFGIQRDGWRRTPLLALVFAGVWLSNAPAGVLATYSLALILIIAGIVGRSLRTLVYGGLAMVGGFGLAAFYLVPAWYEQRWVQIGQAVFGPYDPERNFLFTHVNEPEYIHFNWKMSALAVAVMLFTGLGMAFCFRQRRESQVWWVLAALSLASIFLMLPPSALLWRHLPELRFLQFPWRWLLVLNLAFAFFAAAAGRAGRQWVWWLTLVCAISAMGATVIGGTWWDSEDVSVVVEDIGTGQGYDALDEYQPVGAHSDQLDDEGPRVGEFDPESGDVNEPEDTQINIVQWTAESKVFEAKTDEPVTLALKLLTYPAWQVRVDGKTTASETSPQTGQILVHLDAGTHRVEVEFQRTRDRTVGALVSALFAVGLLVAAGALTFARFRRMRFDDRV
jgi:hypothetical protein